MGTCYSEKTTVLLHPADAAKRPGGKKGKHPKTIAIKELRVGDRIMKVPITAADVSSVTQSKLVATRPQPWVCSFGSDCCAAFRIVALTDASCLPTFF